MFPVVHMPVSTLANKFIFVQQVVTELLFNVVTRLSVIVAEH